MTCILVTHEMGFAREIGDHIYFTDRGVIVEQGSKEQILRNPQQAYTQRLIAAVPVPDPDEQRVRREAFRTAG